MALENREIILKEGNPSLLGNTYIYVGLFHFRTIDDGHEKLVSQSELVQWSLLTILEIWNPYKTNFLFIV